MVGHELAFMDYPCFFPISAAACETALIVACLLGLVLLLDGCHLKHSGGYGGSCSYRCQDIADERDLCCRRIGINGAHCRAGDGLCYLDLHGFLVGLRLDGGYLLLFLLLQFLTLLLVLSGSLYLLVVVVGDHGNLIVRTCLGIAADAAHDCRNGLKHHLILLLNLLDELGEVLSLCGQVLSMSQPVLLVKLFEHGIGVHVVRQVTRPRITGVGITCLFLGDGKPIVHVLRELILVCLSRILSILCLDGQSCLLVVLFSQQFFVVEFLKGIQFHVTLHVIGLMEVVGADLQQAFPDVAPSLFLMLCTSVCYFPFQLHLFQ